MATVGHKEKHYWEVGIHYVERQLCILMEICYYEMHYSFEEAEQRQWYSL